MTPSEKPHPLPPELKQRAVDHLRKTLAPDSVTYLREFHERYPDWMGDEIDGEQHAENMEKYGFSIPSPFHFGAGMAIRNVLREVVRDEQLPLVYSEGYPVGGASNWDDWYTEILDELVSDE